MVWCMLLCAVLVNELMCNFTVPLDEDEAEGRKLKEVVYFLLGRRARVDLLHRKWTKPAPRYQEVWTWIQMFSRLVHNNSEVIVTRSCVTLRVRK